MGVKDWLGANVGAQLARPIRAVDSLIDNAFTSDEERLDKKVLMQRIRQSPYLFALQIAMQDAKSSDKWTSRARPGILYAIIIVFLVQHAFLPTVWWFLQVFWDRGVPPPPQTVAVDVILTLVTGVLGLSTVVGRTKEKLGGVAR